MATQYIILRYFHGFNFIGKLTKYQREQINQNRYFVKILSYAYRKKDFIATSYNSIESASFEWSAPSNIALVKYWGKKENQIQQILR